MHGTDIAAQLAAAETLCARNGVQLTELRREVLTLILQARAPLTAYQLLDQLKSTRKSAVPPTIYRALEFLMENRLVHRIERLNAFVPCAEADHDHADAQFLICHQCGTVTEIEDHGVSAALAAAAAARGFTPERAMIELDGLCATCAPQGTGQPPEPR
jgi:Fur family transcriptional regulator, zinc uptake regulator